MLMGLMERMSKSSISFSNKTGDQEPGPGMGGEGRTK